MQTARANLRLLMCAAAIALAAGVAHAQNPSQTATVGRGSENWPLYSLYEGQQVLVVTASRPKERQKCRVAFVSVVDLVCAGRSGRETSFAKSDIVALIWPASHPNRGSIPLFVGMLSAGGGIIYGAVVIACISTPLIAVAVPVALVGGLVILASPIAFFDDEGGAEPERLLYLAPNENLQFALRS